MQPAAIVELVIRLSVTQVPRSSMPSAWSQTSAICQGLSLQYMTGGDKSYWENLEHMSYNLVSFCARSTKFAASVKQDFDEKKADLEAWSFVDNLLPFAT